MSMRPEYPITKYPTSSRNLITASSALKAGILVVALVVLVAAGVKALNALEDRSSVFPNTGPYDPRPPRQATNTPTPSPTPTPTPCPYALNLLALSDRPVFLLTGPHTPPQPKPSPNLSGCGGGLRFIGGEPGGRLASLNMRPRLGSCVPPAKVSSIISSVRTMRDRALFCLQSPRWPSYILPARPTLNCTAAKIP